MSLRCARPRRLPTSSSNRRVDAQRLVLCSCYSRLRALCRRRRCVGRTFNITNDEPVRLWAAVRQLCTRLALPPPVVQLPVWLADGVARVVVEPVVVLLQGCGLLPRSFEPKLTRYAVGTLSLDCVLDTSAAREALGYQPLVSMQQG